MKFSSLEYLFYLIILAKNFALCQLKRFICLTLGGKGSVFFGCFAMGLTFCQRKGEMDNLRLLYSHFPTSNIFSRRRTVRRSKKWFFIAGEWFDEGKRAFF